MNIPCYVGVTYLFRGVTGVHTDKGMSLSGGQGKKVCSGAASQLQDTADTPPIMEK